MEVKNGSMIQLSLFHEEEEKSIHIGLILEEKKKNGIGIGESLI